jgi:hypothetical protein
MFQAVSILLGGVGAAVAAAIIAGHISHATKISEFRQAWIDKLRKDIADYVGAAHQWIRKYQEINDLPASNQDERAAKERNELFPIANDARVILWRIRLRFNPRDNRYKGEDDALLRNLLDLLNPGRLPPERQTEATWIEIADSAVERAREILKREWEVTKYPQSKLSSLLSRCPRLRQFFCKSP